MPYRHAHWFVGFVLLVIMAGFWASYFGTAGTVPLAFHVHAISAMTWLALLIGQHLTIQRRAHALHSQMGRASFALFPFLILGFVMILNGAAARYVATDADEGIRFLGPSFGIGMGIAIATYLLLYYLALKNRRNVRLHAGYMLATPLILFESPFSRIIGDYLPWLNVIGSPFPRAVLDTIVISEALAIAFALAIWAMNRKYGAPWLVAAASMAIEAAAMWFAPDMPALGIAFAAYGRVPPAVTMMLGVAAGAAIAWAGWQAGKLRPKRAAAAA
ncbi:MAG: hypothetical protein ACKO01_03665 [Erythrobacter sp.]